MAVLATSVSLAAGPASAEECERRIALNEGSSVAALCDDAAEVRAQVTHTSMAVPSNSETAKAVEKLARQLGMPGMSRSTAVFSIADMGGVAAGAGHPALPVALPEESGLPAVAHQSTAPDPVGLPSLPNADRVSALPWLPDLPSQALPALPDVVEGEKAPLKLAAPVKDAVGKAGQTVNEETKKALELDGVKRVTDAVGKAGLGLDPLQN
ncbi:MULTISPECIES: hypothetical protein [unclassified Nonomuraea]